ncbi:Cobalt ion binding protein [Zostera marina]|uniref:Cobalt ion binding protein n=1 Tax=Zostera marina TaxID=29655 RepID=A0A0K9NUF5_ZOSMR|nr:Cobalt ion binding protein [Zostera marina]
MASATAILSTVFSRTTASEPNSLCWMPFRCNGGSKRKTLKSVSSPSFSCRAVAASPNSNYVVPLDKSASLIRPLAEILRDLNKRVPDMVIDPKDNSISWYHANRMLSFYAPGWCGQIRDVIFSDNGTVTVVYRVTIRGSDGEAHRESTGSVASKDKDIKDHVAAAEQMAFCRACARFGLGLYLYHEDEMEKINLD